MSKFALMDGGGKRVSGINHGRPNPYDEPHNHICPNCNANWDCTDTECTNETEYECGCEGQYRMCDRCGTVRYCEAVENHGYSEWMCETCESAHHRHQQLITEGR